MSDKYDVEFLRKRALVHFSQGFPVTLAQWDAFECPSWLTGMESSISAIVLARNFGANWVLPAAFYRLCEVVSVPDILNGVDHNGIHTELSAADKIDVLQGSYLQRDAFVAAIHALGFSASRDECISSTFCSESLDWFKILKGLKVAGCAVVPLVFNSVSILSPNVYCSSCLSSSTQKCRRPGASSGLDSPKISISRVGKSC